MQKSFSIFSLLFVVVVAFSLSLFGATNDEILARDIPLFTPDEENAKLVDRVLKKVNELHFSSPQLSQEAFVTAWYAEYLKMLDPQKIHFTQKDLQQFETFQKRHGATTRQAQLAYAYHVYHRYLERSRQLTALAMKYVSKDIDFNGDEQLLLDRETASYCANDTELQKLWKLRLKNSLLVSKLAHERNDLRKKKKSAQKTPSDASAPADGMVKTNTTTRLAKLTPAERIIRNYVKLYERQLDKNKLEILEIFLNAATALYDPHTNYMIPTTTEEWDIAMSLSFEGIGATLTMKDMYCTVTELIPGGAADKEGTLKAGYRIIEVTQDTKDAEPVDVIDKPLDKIVHLIRGPKGTKVHLTYLEPDSDIPHVVTIVRDKIDFNDAAALSEIREIKVSEEKTARVLVLYLPSFYCDFEGMRKRDPNYRSTTRDIQKLIAEQASAKQGGLDGVVLDLRGNGGGALGEAVQLAGLFFTRGPVVQLRARGSFQTEVLRDNNPSCIFKGPVFVLVDRNSASASEIVAAALQDTGRALVLGTTTTHGKGSFQTLIDVAPDGSETDLGRIKVTNGKFYRINGESTQSRGVLSDIAYPTYVDFGKTGEMHLPHALPWDEINACRYLRYPTFPKPLRDALIEFAKKHARENPDFVAYLKAIEEYKENQNTKTVSLNEATRRAETAHERSIIKRLVHYTTPAESKLRRKNRRILNDDDEEEFQDNAAKDVIMDEALAVFGEYFRLTAKRSSKARPMAIKP